MTNRKFPDNELEKHYQCYVGILEFIKELEQEKNSIITKFLVKEIKNRCKIP